MRQISEKRWQPSPTAGRVDDGQQLLDVVRDERIEERLIVVLQVAHVRVFAEGGGPAVEDALAAVTLIFERPDVRRQQAVQSEGVALLLGKCRALVEARIHQQIAPGEAGANDGNARTARSGGFGTQRDFSSKNLGGIASS